MPKLTSLPTDRVLRALQRAGWTLRPRGGARHHVLVNPALPGIVTVPRHPMVKKGTLAKIIKQAGLNIESFFAHYR